MHTEELKSDTPQVRKFIVTAAPNIAAAYLNNPWVPEFGSPGPLTECSDKAAVPVNGVDGAYEVTCHYRELPNGPHPDGWKEVKAKPVRATE